MVILFERILAKHVPSIRARTLHCADLVASEVIHVGSERGNGRTILRRLVASAALMFGAVGSPLRCSPRDEGRRRVRVFDDSARRTQV